MYRSRIKLSIIVTNSVTIGSSWRNYNLENINRMSLITQVTAVIIYSRGILELHTEARSASLNTLFRQCAVKVRAFPYDVIVPVPLNQSALL